MSLIVICTKLEENSFSLSILTFYQNKLLLHNKCNKKHFYHIWPHFHDHIFTKHFNILRKQIVAAFYPQVKTYSTISVITSISTTFGPFFMVTLSSSFPHSSNGRLYMYMLYTSQLKHILFWIILVKVKRLFQPATRQIEKMKKAYHCVSICLLSWICYSYTCTCSLKLCYTS